MADYVINSLASHLINDPDVTTELSSSDDVYIDVAPAEHGQRYITISQLSEPQLRHLGGSAGLAQAHFQISCWAHTTPIDAAKTANAVRLAIDAIIGTALGVAPDNKTVQSVYVEDIGRSQYVDEAAGATGIFGHLMTVTVWHAITQAS